MAASTISAASLGQSSRHGRAITWSADEAPIPASPLTLTDVIRPSRSISLMQSRDSATIW
ncbi:hypothetical protein ADT27_15200 [Xanthomonas oryzae]|nr:hypothetical protein BE73_18805 [Xanthomonas oryzae pv. oryzicola]AKO01706.1 hypothetical protein ACU15_15595 [Xanthomonas oryzae pv. oryzicola]AKO03732.1 hypothetical protein ACU16_05740 [Xanthomonas oryzae pv. oryzicola]KOR43749.1 hypothetical protein ADT27_15200 [Xanthomonas oryzae]